MEDCVSSSPKHAPELPQEIVEMIIGSVETDFPAALHSCSLVCRAWLHASQAKIFESISLASCSAKVRSFFDVLQSSPSLGKCVRELEVVSVRDVTPVWDVEDLNMLQVILTKLDCLRLLHVYGICPSKIWPHVSRSLQLFPMESVLELGLFAFDFLDTEFFISFFTNATPNVQSIIAKGIYVLTSPDMTFPRAPISGFMDCGSAPVLPQLLSLELNNLDAPEMYQILLSSFVQSLEVVLCSTHNIEVFCLLFRDSHAASSLVEITLTKFWGDTANIGEQNFIRPTVPQCEWHACSPDCVPSLRRALHRSSERMRQSATHQFHARQHARGNAAMGHTHTAFRDLSAHLPPASSLGGLLPRHQAIVSRLRWDANPLPAASARRGPVAAGPSSGLYAGRVAVLLLGSARTRHLEERRVGLHGRSR